MFAWLGEREGADEVVKDSKTRADWRGRELRVSRSRWEDAHSFAWMVA